MHRIRLAVVSACLMALLPMASTFGHAELKTAEPGPGDKVADVPGELVARFTQDLRADRTSLELRDPDGKRIAEGGKDPDRARVQRMELPTLDPGRYEVRWVTFSAEDDEIARGKYRFTVTPPAVTPSPRPALVDCPSPPPSIEPEASQAPIPSAEPSLAPEPSMAAEPSMAPGPSPEPGASPIPEPSDDPCAPQDIDPDPEESPAP